MKNEELGIAELGKTTNHPNTFRERWDFFSLRDITFAALMRNPLRRTWTSARPAEIVWERTKGNDIANDFEYSQLFWEGHCPDKFRVKLEEQIDELKPNK